MASDAARSSNRAPQTLSPANDDSKPDFEAVDEIKSQRVKRIGWNPSLIISCYVKMPMGQQARGVTNVTGSFAQRKSSQLHPHYVAGNLLPHPKLAEHPCQLPQS